MKKRKWLNKCAASLLGCAMAFQFLPSAAVINIAAEEQTKQDASQMVSQEETVYFNKIADSDRMVNFNENWKFILGDTTGAQNTAFDDSSWDLLNLPHDYSIDQDYSGSMEAESGYKPGGTGWYRKIFTVDPAAKGKRVIITFNGVYMNATVYINGVELGTHPYGYTQFSFDLTDCLNYEGDNVIAVKVDHQTPSSRWYSGSGIYRDVYVSVLDEVHVDTNGVYVTTPDLASEYTGQVKTVVSTDVVNDSDEQKSVTVRQTIKYGDTKVAVKDDVVTLAANETRTVDSNVYVNAPNLWSMDNPHLYTVTTEIIEGDTVMDSVDTTFGYRWFNFDADTGFSLNGQNVKLKGVCMHHDQGSLGSVADDDAIYRQVKILKEMGCNAIRVTHNPADEALLQAASELGLVVINELFDGWTQSKNGNYHDYGEWFDVSIDEDNQILDKEDGDTWAEFDTRSAIKSSRNEASVIMYSICNEVQEGTDGKTSAYPSITDSMIGWIQENDSSHLITLGSNDLKSNGSVSLSMADKISDAGGVVGYNYTSGSQYDSAHSSHSDWAIVGSETASAVNSRGIYYRTGGSATYSDQQLTSYDNSCVGWGNVASDAWYTTITRDFVAGEFVWTGFDYLGEPTPWNGTGSGWVVNSSNSPKNSYFGIIDTAGLPKDTYYLYQALWNDDVNTLHILPTWDEEDVTKDSSGNVPVVVYSDAAAVELFFTDADGNTNSLGKKKFTKHTTPAGYTYQLYEGSDKNSTAHKNLYLTWNVPYEEGTLYAVAYDENGNVISNTEGRSSVSTTSAEATLTASADKTVVEANGTDLIYVEIDVTDVDGNIVNSANDRITVTVDGAELAGLDNGNSPDHQSYRDDNRQAHAGKLVAIVRTTKESGPITITATADGLESAVVTAAATPVASEGSSDEVIGLKYSRNYYVKTGTMPVLPDTIKAVKADGSEESAAVVWDTISEDQVSRTGTFTVKGICDGRDVSVTINVIDEIGSILNYSAGVMVGQVPVLPASRPAVLADGTVMDTSFDVTWDMPDSSAFDTEGTVVITGSAVVFGEEATVTASIRVGQADTVVGDNVAGAAHLSQSIPEDKQSDNLASINDGVKETYDTNGRWSNYNYCINNPENNKASITFSYDTQQIFGQFTITFYKDSGSATWPDTNTTSFEVSEDGENWNVVNTTETIGTANGNFIEYTYDFSPVQATFVRLNVVNAAVSTGSNNPCTAITEVEMKRMDSKFSQKTSAELESLSIGGSAVSLASVSDYALTTTLSGTIEAVGKDNASVTVLPLFNEAVRILVVSEDGNTMNMYTIRFKEATADDDSRDIDISLLKGDAGSAYTKGESATDGPASFAMDGNESTWWHSDWDGDDRENLWIELSSKDGSDMLVDGLRYLPRTDGATNGIITKYRIDVKNSDGSWRTVASGDWALDSSWKWVTFDQVRTTAVRLYAVDSASNSSTANYASAAELRITGTADAPVIPIEPDDSSRDISVDILTPVAGSEQRDKGSEGNVEFALDNDEGTWWHSLWAGDEDENLWIELDAAPGKTLKVDGLRYLPRSGSYPNGRITKYEIKALDADGNWGSVASGDWADDGEWKMATFDAVETTAIRLYAVESVSDQEGLRFASAVEVRLTGSVIETDKSELQSLVDSALALSLDEYEDDEAWTAFQEALANARAVLDNETALQRDVNAAKALLETAISALNLKKPAVDPTDNSRDIDVSVLTATAGSEERDQGSEGNVEFALDNDENTWWHTAWAGDEDENLWIELASTDGSKMTVDGLRYLPRSGSYPNGRITKYEVKVLADDGSWTSVDTGDWASDGEWKISTFDAVETTAVRLYAIESVSDVPPKKFASAVEVRLTGTVAETDLSALKEAIALSKVISLDLYEENDAWTAYQEALANAKAVLASANVSQKDADAAAQALINAVAALSRKAADATDDSRDIPVDRQTPKAGSEERDKGSEGNVEFAIDGDTGTWWHSLWASDDRENLWIELSSADGEMMTVDGIRYLPRSGQYPNGIITGYAVKALINDEWVTVAEGSWANDSEWKSAEFAPVRTTAVRLYAVESYADVSKNLASAAEYRLTGAIDDPAAEVDKRELEAAIKTAQALDPADYEADEAWEAFEAALKAAKEVLADEEADQDVVDAAAKALNDAVAALNEKQPEPEVDKSELEAAVKAAEEIDPADYEADSAWDAFEAALKDAKSVLADEDADQDVVDAAAKALNDAVSALNEKQPEPEVDKSKLEAAVKAAEEIDPADYEADSAWDAFEAALKDAKSVLADEDADQDAVDAAAKALNDAVSALNEKQPEPEPEVDKSELEAAVKAAEELDPADYEADSAWDAFEAALKGAKSVLADEEADQNDVDGALRGLRDAVSALNEKKPEPGVDLSDLKSLVEDCLKDIDPDAYEADEAWEAYEKALEAAQKLLEKEDVTQDEIDAAREALSDALKNIAPIVEQEVKVIYRAYNPNDGDHLYSANLAEIENAVKAGWTDEGVAWISPKSSSKPVFRVYDKNSGEHHYTTDENELQVLCLEYGWRAEGVAWYSDVQQTVDVYRLYNPNAKGAGRHHWTVSEHEYKTLISLGWKDESVGFHAVSME